MIKNICVFCGSSPGNSDIYLDSVKKLGKLIAQNGWTLVYGGARVGTMGVLADSALENNGKVIGVMPKLLIEKEVAHNGLSDFIEVDSMSERKEKLAQLSDAFVALPGGFGTMDEIFEMLTWAQLGLHQKPCAFLDINNYYKHLFQFFSHSVSEKFVKNDHLEMIIKAKKPVELINKLNNYYHSEIKQWKQKV